MNRKQKAVIDYLLEENRVLKDQLQGRKLKPTASIMLSPLPLKAKLLRPRFAPAVTTST